MRIEIEISNRTMGRLLLIGLLPAIAGIAFAEQFSGIPHEPVSNQRVSAQEMLENFESIEDYVNSLDARLSQIQNAEPRVVVSAFRNTTQPVSSGGGVVEWNNEAIDTANAFNTTTFSVPRSGSYEICAHVNWFEAELWPASTDLWVDAEVISATSYTLRLDLRRLQVGSPETEKLGFFGGCRVHPLVAGDRVRIIAGTTAGVRTIHNHSNLSIVEL